MTILSAKNTPRNTYTATAGQTAFTIGFEFFSVNDVKVYKNGTLMTYDASPSTNTTYKITGTASASDDAYEFGAGGTVTFGSGVALNDSIVIIRDITIERTTDFNPSGAFDISTLNTQLDTIISIMADTQEQTNRSVKLSDTDVTSATVTLPTNANRASKVLSFDASGNAEATLTTTGLSTLSGITSDITTVAGIASDVTTVAGISANVTTVSGISGNVTTVAGISSDVTTTAGISSNVTTVAGLSTEITALSGVSSQDLIDVAALSTELQTLAPIASDITTVAGVSGNVTTVAGISSDVSTVSGISANTTTVAGISGNVTTVAGISSDVSTVAGISANVTTVAGDTANIATVAGNTTNINTVATNITDVNTFANRYRISATAPTTSLDVGDLYYDTTDDIMKVYGSSGWQNAGSSVNGTSARFQYSVSSSTTTITGTDDNGNTLLYDAGYVDVYLNGIKMVNGSDVTVTSGSSVVFATAIGTSGTDTVDIIAYGTFNVAAIDATSITSGTLGYARGGTGLGTLGSADEVLQVNAGGTALEYGKVQAGNLDVASNGTAGQVLASDGDGTFSWADAPSAFSYNAVSGTTPSLDVGSYNFFNQGSLTGDTTISFASVPTEAKWEYTFQTSGASANYDLTKVVADGEQVRLKGGGVKTSTDASANTAYGIDFSSDGLNFYITDDQTDAVKQYSLKSPYHLSSAEYVSQYSLTATLGTAPDGLRFSTDGTKMYVCVNDNVVQYNLSTAWALSSISSNTIKNITATTQNVQAIDFKSDGTKVFLFHADGIIRRYSLSTAWDISTLSYDTNSFNVNAAVSAGTDEWGMRLSSDGTKIIVLHQDGNLVKLTLSTAYDLSTASVSQEQNWSSFAPLYYTAADFVRAFHMLPDGSKMWLQGYDEDTINGYNFIDAYDLTLPSSVQNAPKPLLANQTVKYTFFTGDGGTNVYLIDEQQTWKKI